MEDDFDMMEVDLVMMEDDQNLLFPLKRAWTETGLFCKCLSFATISASDRWR